MHLFLHCEMAYYVWKKVMVWMGVNFVIPYNLFSHYECWMREARGKALRKGFALVWHATNWVIWRARNDKVFNNVSKVGEELLDEVKVLS